MTWLEIISIFVFVFVILGTYRVYKTERIRIKCLHLAVISRQVPGATYVHPEKEEHILVRAASFERFVRKGPEKPKGEDTS
jgi:hypothetical protein